MGKVFVVGVDPSSTKCAQVTTEEDTLIKFDTIAMPTKDLTIEEKCRKAGDWMQETVRQLRMDGLDPWYLNSDINEVHVYIERPIGAKYSGGYKSAIPIALTVGALVHGAFQAGATSVTLVDIGTWKKVIVGNGNASKSLVARWCRIHWRNLYRAARADQDVIDAAAINRYGNRIVPKRKPFTRVAPRRLTKSIR